MNTSEQQKRRNETLVASVSAAILVLIALLDYLTGPEVSFRLLYFIPVLLASWYGRQPAGGLLAAASSVLWFIADRLSGATYSREIIRYLNATTLFAVYVITSVALSRVKITSGHLKAALQREVDLARTDFLTGVLNLRAFREVAEMERIRALHFGRPLTVGLIAVRNFRSLTDQLSRKTGDAVLVTLVKGIRKFLRETDTVGRVGGDEFAVLLPELGLETSRSLFSEMNDQLLGAVGHNGWPATLSIVSVTFLAPVNSVDAIFDEIESVLTQVKKDGGGNAPFHVVFEPSNCV